MAEPVVTYEGTLPEIPTRLPHEPPTSYLMGNGSGGYDVVEGRRPSRLFLVNRLRAAVDRWRDGNYTGASTVSRRLLSFWFDEDHLVDGDLFRLYFGQREAVETVIYLTEVARVKDLGDLVETYGEVFYPEGAQRRQGEDFRIETSAGGVRRLWRYVPERDAETSQELPRERLIRYALKAATGSGKTVTAAMIVVWSYFHKLLVAESPLSTHFLLVAPNVIVYQRLERDFGAGRIFYELPLVPPEWRGRWALKTILRGESAEPDPSGNLFLVNIQQIYESRETQWTPANAVDALLGRKPVQDLASHERSMLERLKSLPHLVVLNDEAHHVHDDDLQWNQTLLALHDALPNGLSLWLDFSATPKDQNGTYFPWIVSDYPLAQAVEDRIVKVPLIVHRVDREDPADVTAENAADVYSEWLLAALSRWREHTQAYERLKLRPVLFIMAENSKIADAIGEWLVGTPECGLKQRDVLVIHTRRNGEILNRDLEKAREAARDIDQPGNPVKVIVSVMMLREGWDVRNVSVVLGLRPFNANAQILPEQAVGRGLRLMRGVSPDRTQTLEVMGTKAFEDFVLQLEQEGVGVPVVATVPSPPVWVEPVLAKADMDIVLPITRPVYSHDHKKLHTLDPLALQPQLDLDQERKRATFPLEMEHATTNVKVGEVQVDGAPSPPSHDIVSTLTNDTMSRARLSGCFSELYPKVRAYLAKRCFGQDVDLDDEEVRGCLAQYPVRERLAKYLASAIGKLTAERREVTFENAGFRLFETTPFHWRRNLPLVASDKTVFNLVATFNNFEKTFARFLDTCDDVARFAALGTTEQGSGTSFKVDYLKPSGALGFYFPDFVVVQRTDDGEINWIVETKGRVYEGTEAKDDAITYWCSRVSEQTQRTWRYRRVNQPEFDPLFAQGLDSFQALLDKTTA